MIMPAQSDAWQLEARGIAPGPVQELGAKRRRPTVKAGVFLGEFH